VDHHLIDLLCTGKINDFTTGWSQPTSAGGQEEQEEDDDDDDKEQQQSQQRG